MATLAEALNSARQALGTGRFAEAESLYRQLLEAVPLNANLWHELGLVYLQTNRPEAACDCLQRANSIEPRTPMILSNLGAAYRRLRRPRDAATCFRHGLESGPATPELYNNLALALKDARQEPAALSAFDSALSLRPDYATAHFNRANLLLEMGRLPESMAAYRRSLDLEPRDAGAWCKLGVAHYDAAEMADAVACFDRALELQPNYAEPRRNRAMVWLAEGDYQRGWPEFEYRLRCDGFVQRAAGLPQWQGEPLAGRTLLLHAEQGLGDTLQFVRYVPLVERFGGTVKLEVQPALVPLLRASGFERWLVDGGESPGCDLQCPLLSLPRFVPEPNGRPYWGGPYLRAEADRVATWEPRIQSYDGFRVGIVWRGNPDHPHDRFRSVSLAAFAPLAQVPGVRLISLQKGISAVQLATMAENFEVIDLGSSFDSGEAAFLDTAAVMQHLDLVVSVDTSIVHLAGGLGLPTWVPLHYSPDWRWQLTGSHTPWYASLRLFRQASLGAWAPVFEQITEALRDEAAGRC